jgi:hypothetical protein
MVTVRRSLAAAVLSSGAIAFALAGEPTARGDETKPAQPSSPPSSQPTVFARIDPTPPTSPLSSVLSITAADGKTVNCREQAAQSFLIRSSWFPRTNDAEKVKEGRKLLDDAIRYRTEKYGYFPGFGNPKWNAHPPKFYAKAMTFMGMSVQVNERIIPALKCVEAALKASPAGDEYKPHAMGGIRFQNTYRGVEISNHVYGIAIDIEPDRNTCCGCVAPWPNHPLCKAKGKTIWQRMAMPKSWVDTFEKYGFYWLGHDVLQDTMHFEFLGDPDKSVEAPASP